jgi:hypothetical protein
MKRLVCSVARNLASVNLPFTTTEAWSTVTSGYTTSRRTSSPVKRMLLATNGSALTLPERLRP